MVPGTRRGWVSRASADREGDERRPADRTLARGQTWRSIGAPVSRLGAFLGSPVVFQPLERELAPVAKYLCGKVLNAGCGERDVSGYLLGHGATSVENCDLSPALPDAIACELSKIPRPASTYDSALCNAVLEHVRAPTDVLTE